STAGGGARFAAPPATTAESRPAMIGEYLPSLRDVRRLAGAGNVVPVYREVRADLETPVSAFLKVARGPYSYLLESVEGGERMGRYSFIGTEPYRVLSRTHEDGDPLLEIERE